ncbi:glycoside hydrolase family 172 protein [Bacteroidota bacterium]
MPFLLLLSLINGCSHPVSLNSLLEEMTSRHHLSYFPDDQYKLKQFSSYNSAAVAPGKDGWFANNDMSHFLRIDSAHNRREFVMFDADGPGAIVRWWMTFYLAQNGILRVYLDNDTIPVIQGIPSDVLSGNLLTEYPLTASVHSGAPLGEEGRDYDHNMYLPIPFAKHCKITYECDSLVLKYDYEGVAVEEGYYWPDVFYNICYRQYHPKTKVESFSQKGLFQAKPLLNKVNKTLLDNHIKSSDVAEFGGEILSGDSLIIGLSGKGQVVNKLSIELKATDLEQALRSTVISASFDSITTIWVPVGEFFGTGYMLSPHKTWMNETNDNGKLESNWVMPFKKNCKILFINYGTDDVTMSGSAGISEYQWKSNSMYFGASWHEYRHIKTRNDQGSKFDINYIDISAKGIYVGDQITLFNNTYHWWGEGDEKIFVDGEKFPSSFGTGSEDYYGYAFGRPEPFTHPFLAQPTGTGNTNWGLTVNMRHRSLDAIPFTTSISSNIELWHWASIQMNYALTTYWYVKYPFKVNIEPDIRAVQFPVAKSKEDFILQ